ncbi:MAG: hypothetical protein K2H49_08430 [Muribaculaceae bacterium]|nr:hypothetical protein [Muribaculaceae bacterium]
MSRLQTIAISLFCILTNGCGRVASVPENDSADSQIAVELDSLQVEHDISVEARLWADSIMDSMTLEEMAGQLVMPAVYADDSGYALRIVREYATDSHVGGVVLLKGNVRGARAIADTLRAMVEVPPFIAIDAEWGLAMRLEGTPGFPRNGQIASDADEILLFDYGYEVARECREAGINMVLGPVLDVLPSGRRSSGIGSRSFGCDAGRVARLGVAYAKGVESGGVLSVAKHFPGHGSADADSHKRMPLVAKTREDLEAADLLPFREYIANGLSAIMTGHLNVPALDEEEVPVTVSKKILDDYVRKELGFRGLIVTDALNMAGAGGKSAADAIMAGADMVLAPADTEMAVVSIADIVRSGRFSLSGLRDRVGRVLFYKFLVARVPFGSGNIGDTYEAERICKLLR